ncbi:MAG: choice-of-anchor D domain-containing protein, partial [Candidatus Eisenbacteria bacterium]|nr:choice-of-anchor D domain-containing protein [Candidatus Eisenbacteria bacterium]
MPLQFREPERIREQASPFPRALVSSWPFAVTFALLLGSTVGWAWADPTCEVDPTSLDFGTVTAGDSLDLPWTVRNIGDGVLEGAVDVGPSAFRLVEADSAFALGAGEARTFTIRFAPPDSGSFVGTIDPGTATCPSVPLGGSGELPPACVVTPGLLDFATVTVGESRDLAFDVENVGGGVVSGAVDVSCAGFTLLEADSTYVLAAGERRTFTVRFAPPSAGPFACAIDLGSPECGTLNAQGNGDLPPACRIDPAALDFGIVTVGSTEDRTFTIENIGGGVLTGSVDVPCPEFSLVDGDPVYSLAVGEIREFTVRFAPPDSGDFACAIDPGSSCGTLPAAGRGDLPPACAIDPPDGLAFGDIVVGESADLTMTIRNVGGGLLGGTVSEPCGSFEIVGDASYALAADEEREFVVRFAPDADGAQVCPLDLGSTSCPDSYQASGVGVLLPSCEVTPTLLDFGTIVVGQPSEKTFTIHNSGAGHVVGAFTSTCPEFVVVDAGDYDVGPFSSLEFRVRYQPVDEGTDECMVLLGGQCADVTVRGTGIESPQCDVMPTTLDFGTLEVGQSESRSFTITNRGGQHLNGTVSVDCPDFHLQGSRNYSLGADESRDFTIRFTPNTAGPASCRIETGSADCVDVDAQGSAVLPSSCGVQPIALRFGELAPGESHDLFFRISNTGGQVLSGTVEAGCGEFAVLGERSYQLSPGTDRLFTVRFAPMDTGEQSCELGLGNDLCVAVELSGSRRAPISRCTLSPSSIAFPATPVGEVSEESFSLKNEGETVLSGRITADCEPFALPGDPDYELEPGASRTFTIEFRPAVPGEFACEIATGDEACGSIPVTGSSPVDAACRIVPTALDFGSIDIGTSVERTFRIDNIGHADIEGVVSSRESCPGFALVGPTGYLLAPGQSQEFRVRFEPETPGATECTMMTGSPGCPTLAVRGEGLLAPRCEIRPPVLDLGQVPVGTAARATLTIANSGLGLLEGDLT